MTGSPTLIYGYDPLCGWCYGAIPALRYLRQELPDLAIEVLPGGLVTGDRIRPYSELVGYIRGASKDLERVTGQKPSEAFFALISGANPPLASSLQPSDAVRQVKEAAPDKTLDFAHAIQEAHFFEGRDLNDPALYDEITKKFNIPAIQSDYWSDQATLKQQLSASFERSRDLGIASFPSYVMAGKKVHTLACSYDGVQLASSVRQALTTG